MSSGVGFPHSAENPRRLPHNDGPPPTPAHSAPLWLVFSRPRVCFPFALIHSRLRRPPGRPTSFFAHTVFMRVMCTPFFRVQRVQITFHLPSSAFICLPCPPFLWTLWTMISPAGIRTPLHTFSVLCALCAGAKGMPYSALCGKARRRPLARANRKSYLLLAVPKKKRRSVYPTPLGHGTDKTDKRG